MNDFIKRPFEQNETSEPTAKTMEQTSEKKEERKEPVTVHHLIVLDESGSMCDVTAQTISGCNETLGTIRQMQEDNQESQRHFVSIYAFDSDLRHSRYIIEDKAIASVNNVTDKDYRPNGCTPLYDAAGFTLTNLGAKLNQSNSMGYVTIITDGYENSSTEYNLQRVKAIIEELKKRNVIFSFIGANIDAAEYGKGFGIDNTLQFSADEAGMHDMWENERRSKLRSSRRMRFYTESSHYSRKTMEDFGECENAGSYYEEFNAGTQASPEVITSLRPNEVFVFGSNKRGMHTGGAAGFAYTHFGAVMGQAEGRQGQSYAIPTDNVPLWEIEQFVMDFIEYARNHPELTFLVTKIGCGNAGLKVKEIAPLFYQASNCKNIRLPQAFIKYLNGEDFTF